VLIALLLLWLLATLSPTQRVQRARIAALTRWSQEDPKATAERGQAGLRAKFVRETRERFPDLGDAEIDRRAEAAYRAHMARLSFRRSKTRTPDSGAA
jgi:hypothetical protein